MAIQLLHISDIHLGSGEGHGRLNPETGLNRRFEDFAQAFSKAIDYALKNSIDIFLFSGDAYKHANPEPQYQKVFAQELKRLSQAKIPTILLVGNHDQVLKATKSHAMSVFQSLEIPHVTIIDRPQFQTIDTKSGALQLIGLPYITKHQLASIDKYKGLLPGELSELLQDHLKQILQDYYQRLDNTIPSVLTAHLTLDRAVTGVEQELLLGYTQTFATELFIDQALDYVALGHVHKHQIIRPANPAIVYAGSLERIDFGEANEDKGFVHVTLERQSATYKFISINPRPFITLDLDLSTKYISSTSDIFTNEQLLSVPKGAIVRIRCKLRQEQLPLVSEDAIAKLLPDCLSMRVTNELTDIAQRTRMPEINHTDGQHPLKALENYLEQIAPKRKEQLLDKAKILVDHLQTDN
jgi:exonuclease SbcD